MSERGSSSRHSAPSHAHTRSQESPHTPKHIPVSACLAALAELAQAPQSSTAAACMLAQTARTAWHTQAQSQWRAETPARRYLHGDEWIIITITIRWMGTHQSDGWMGCIRRRLVKRHMHTANMGTHLPCQATHHTCLIIPEDMQEAQAQQQVSIRFVVPHAGVRWPPHRAQAALHLRVHWKTPCVRMEGN